jgi:transposase InsO family protein
MSERIRFIARLEEGESPRELAEEFGISAKTAYKFWDRWKRDGLRGLEDRSHAPRRIPHRTPPEVIELALQLRKEHPHWGGYTLKARLEARHPGVQIPSSTTISNWLKKNNLIAPRKPRRRYPRPERSPLTQACEPNDVWATDFKGQFRLGNRSLCYPLTATDLASRFILVCDALESTKAEPVWFVFERMFEEYGLPSVIRTDNGVPFASRGLAGLTKLSAKWLRLSIRHERIEPGQPQQNGQHERMHRTLKQETTRPAKGNLLQQQERFDAFVEEFNEIRPHHALDMKCPATIYRPSERRYQGLPDVHYPLADDVRRVFAPGGILMPDSTRCFLSQALVGEEVGLREVEDGRWLITYATLDLGYYDERVKAFEPIEEAKSNERSPISIA